MQLAFDATTLVGHISGVGYYTARLLEALKGDAGQAIERLIVLSNRPVPVTPAGRVETWTAHRFPIRSLWMQLFLPRILRALRPDLVHYTNFLAPVVGRTPFVVTVHDMSLALYPQYHTMKKRLLTSTVMPTVLRKARLVLTPSESARADVVRLAGVPAGRVRVIPHAAPRLFHPEAGGAARLRAHGVREPYFLYVGTLEPRKNLTRTLRAFTRVADAMPDHQFVLVGQTGWKYGDILREAHQARAADRVRLLGYVPEEDLPALYTHATALVYPSLYEGFGFPVVEAMACGTPVLTSRTSSLGEIAKDAALLVEPTDESAIAEGLAALAHDGRLREDLRAKGLARAASFSWEKTARMTVAAYQEAIG